LAKPGAAGRVGDVKTRLVVSIVVLAAAVGWTSPANGAPHYAYRDLPEAIVLGDLGRTSFAAWVNEAGVGGSVTRSLGSRLDLVMRVAAGDPFDLQARVLIVRDLLPLNVLVAFDADRIALSSTLFLGPVHLNVGRAWGSIPERWAFLQYAPQDTLCVLIGLGQRAGRLTATLGLRFFPGQTGLWGISIATVQGRARLTVGGVR